MNQEGMAFCSEAAAPERISWLRDEIMKRKGSWVLDPNPFERDVALYRTDQKFSVVHGRAALLRELVKLAAIRIYPDWRLAGEHLPLGFGFLNQNNRRQVDRIKELGVDLLTVAPISSAGAAEYRFSLTMNVLLKPLRIAASRSRMPEISLRSDASS